MGKIQAPLQKILELLYNIKPILLDYCKRYDIL